MAKYSFRKSEKSKKSKRGHFAALCLCMAALGAVSWYALDFAVNLPAETGGDTATTSSKPLYVFDTTSGTPGPVSSAPQSSVKPPESSAPDEMPTGAEATFFVMPVAGSVIKEYSPDAPVYSETFLDFRVHSGVDISAKVDSPISSAGHGVVQSVGADEMLGNYVAIDHGNGIVAYYFGLAQHIMVREGQTVEASQPIGTVGTVPAECLDAPHIHLYVEKDGKPVPPMETLGLK